MLQKRFAKWKKKTNFKLGLLTELALQLIDKGLGLRQHASLTGPTLS